MAIDNVEMAPTVQTVEYVLDLEASVTDENGIVSWESLESLVLSGVPEGAVLSVGTDNGDGTWSIDVDGLTEFDGTIVMHLPSSVSGEINITATAAAVESGAVGIAEASDSVAFSSPFSGGELPNVILANEQFELGEKSGWESSNGGVDLTEFNNSMMIRVENQETISKTFDFGAENANQTVSIDFSAYLEGTWDSSGGNADEIIVKVNGEVIDTLEFNYSSDFDHLNGDGIDVNGDGSVDGHDSWHMEDISFEAETDGNGVLEVEIYSDSTGVDELIGIDNFTIEGGSEWDNYTLALDGEARIQISSEAGEIDSISGTDANEFIIAQSEDTVDAAEGVDTILLPEGESIDFGKLANIEKIDMTNGDVDSLTINVENVFSITDNDNTLIITGDDSDSVTLEGDWTPAGTTETVDGVDYNVYNATYNDGGIDQDVQILIDQDLDV